ncbi:MAG: Lrp/AsnC family transcriptional regulator [Candidatus Anstonellales archaeon]
MNELNSFERKILYELDYDASRSASEIANRLNTSPQRVLYAINSFLKKRLIKNLIGVIDYRKAGYGVHFVYYNLKWMKRDEEEKMIAYLDQSPNVGIVLRCEGRWNLSIGFFAKSLFDLLKEVRKVENLFGAYILDSAKTSHLGSYHGQRSFLWPEKEERRRYMPITGSELQAENLDEVDLKLLSLLSRDARAKSVDLAKKVSSTPEKVAYRIKKLREKKVLQTATFLPDYSIYPFFRYRVLLKFKSLSQEKEESLFYALAANKNVLQAIKNYGSYDMSIDIEIEDKKKLRENLHLILSPFEDLVHSFDAVLVYDVPKFFYFPTV